MSKQRVSRRQVLRTAALAASFGTLEPALAQHVHQETAAAAKKTAGVYVPKLFNAQEWKTVKALCDWIIPAEGAAPAASASGTPEFIDVLAANNEQLKEIWLGGLGWLDAAMRRRTGKPFADSSATEQKAMLDVIAYRKNESPETGPGIRFFDWARRMTVDGFYTSPAGIKELGYAGNKGMTVFQVPKEALEYALKRSPAG